MWVGHSSLARSGSAFVYFRCLSVLGSCVSAWSSCRMFTHCFYSFLVVHSKLITQGRTLKPSSSPGQVDSHPSPSPAKHLS